MAGILLSSRSITKLKVVASSATPKDSSSPSLSNQPPNIINIKPNKLPKTDYRKKQNQQQQQPPILEIERAIGAGIFRDRDVNSGGEEERPSNMFDNIMRNSVGKNEGSVEKKLRETGEWLIQQTDNTSGAGKQILTTVFVWLIPMWIAAFLVASGVVELPFHTPFLDDLLL